MNNTQALHSSLWLILVGLALFSIAAPHAAQARATIDKSVARLQSIDKVTARTSTYDVKVGDILQFGPLYVKVQSCRVAPDIEEAEAAAFLQIWEQAAADTDIESVNLAPTNIAPTDVTQPQITTTPAPQAPQPSWVFSGWMFASSPGLSSMDHPIYDVWLLGCAGETMGTAEITPDTSAPESTSPQTPQQEESRDQ